MPTLDGTASEAKRASIRALLIIWACKGGGREKISDIAIDRVFIGSCTNGRIEDLRIAAKMIAGRTVSERVNAMVVPGSGLVKEQAEAEGLDKIFRAAGFDWREPGCSMCLAMNPDRLAPGERCASTSNRNFEGRQGFKGPAPTSSLPPWRRRRHRRPFRRRAGLALEHRTEKCEAVFGPIRCAKTYRPEKLQTFRTR